MTTASLPAEAVIERPRIIERPSGPSPTPASVSLGRTSKTSWKTFTGLAKARRAGVLLGLIVAWQLAVASGWMDARMLPAPTTVAVTFWSLLASGQLEHHLLISLTRAAVGLFFGVAIGGLLGTAAGLFRLGEELVDAPVQSLRMLPHLALVPLIILWVGIGEASKDVLVALGTFFPVYINVFSGIRNVDQRLIEAGGVFGLSRFGLLREVVLPGALPSALVGLRQSLGVAWLSLVVAEQINASSGIGYLMTDAREFMRTDVILVGLVAYALLGLATDLIVRTVEGRALTWRRSFSGA